MSTTWRPWSTTPTGEFDRYRNSYEMFNKKELDYRQWYARNQLPTTLRPWRGGTAL